MPTNSQKRAMQMSLTDALVALKNNPNDQEALLCVVELGQPVIQAACRSLRFLGADEVEDAIQKTWLRVWQNLHLFDEARGAGDSWMAKIARNICRDWRRQRGRGPTASDIADKEHTLRSSDLEPWAVFENEQDMIEIRSAVDNLPPELREVIVLSYYKRIPAEEIQERLRITRYELDKRRIEGLAKLRKILRKQGWD